VEYMRHLLKRALLILLLLYWSCGPELSSSSYGRVRLEVGDQEIFFKRKASGLNRDVTVISPRGDLCNTPNSKTDYIFRESNATPVFYRIENGALILFVSIAATPPESAQFPVKVVQRELNPLELLELEESSQKRGVKRLDMPFDSRLKCLD
jgi:hypothetical protein